MKQYLLLISSIIFLLVISSNVSANLSSDFFFDNNYLYDTDDDVQKIDLLQVEGREYNLTNYDHFLFDINEGDMVRNVTYYLIRTSSPERNNTYHAWYIQPLDNQLYSLWRNQGSNSTLGPQIMANLEIIGTDCTDNPTCYASNISSIIREGNFDDLLAYLRPDDRFLINPRGNYINSPFIIYQNRNTNTTLEKITPNTFVQLEWDTAYPVNATTLLLVMTTPNHDIKGFKLLNLYLDENKTLSGFVILLTIMGIILLGFAWMNPDYYVKLVLLFFSGFFFMTNFMLTNSFMGTTYFNIATFMSVAYNMMGLVLLGMFIYLFFSIGIIYVILPVINKMRNNGKKKR